MVGLFMKNEKFVDTSYKYEKSEKKCLTLVCLNLCQHDIVVNFSTLLIRCNNSMVEPKNIVKGAY